MRMDVLEKCSAIRNTTANKVNVAPSEVFLVQVLHSDTQNRHFCDWQLACNNLHCEICLFYPKQPRYYHGPAQPTY